MKKLNEIINPLPKITYFISGTEANGHSKTETTTDKGKLKADLEELIKRAFLLGAVKGFLEDGKRIDKSNSMNWLTDDELWEQNKDKLI
jgi:hypothetical protein